MKDTLEISCNLLKIYKNNYFDSYTYNKTTIVIATNMEKNFISITEIRRAI